MPTKRICAWNPADVASFFRAVARDNGQDPSRLNVGKLYGLDGPALLRLDEIDFLERDPMNGAQWYRALRKFVDRRKPLPLFFQSYVVLTLEKRICKSSFHTTFLLLIFSAAQVGLFTPKMEPAETSPYVTDPHAPFLTSHQSSGTKVIFGKSFESFTRKQF